ncbi:hypothetical protein K0M31_015731 [Melipona bicolor]|uniref:NADH dehydrogenase [ubiquinone] 1 beta subcomplex subunit 8, mitochondrial n=1 Tax=Melipona bicolor TaxID=60889 RepID=A0AA40KF30_9HYME|nr:hypothetical protein K0M31_015731 [Melipona bicolor]
MAAIRNCRNLSKILSVKNKPFINFTRKYEELVDDDIHKAFRDDFLPSQIKYLPDLYPKTKEEWNAAAARYGLHPDEYKPWDPLRDYNGDYPDLPLISYDAKDPYYPWDYPATRTNYQEALPLEFQNLLGDRLEYGVRQPIEHWKAALLGWSIFGVCLILFWIMPDTNQALLAKQYPGQGKHYTFELK